MALKEAILGLLYNGPMTGYEIKKFYRDTIRHFWNVSDGQLYPTLKRMTEDGFIDMEVLGGKDDTIKKHRYSITEKGKQRFVSWLKKPVHKFEELKEPFLIKLFFFDKITDEHKFYHLKVQYELHQDVLNEFLEIKRLYGDKVPRYQRIIIDLGILYVQVRILFLLRMMQVVADKKLEEPVFPQDIDELLWKFFYAIFSKKPLKKYFKDEFFKLDIKDVMLKFLPEEKG